MYTMISSTNRSGSNGSVRLSLAIVIVFAMVASVSQLAAAPSRTNRRDPPAPADRRRPPEAPADHAIAPEPAEPEETAPERKYENLPVDLPLQRKESTIRTILREGKFTGVEQTDDFDKFYTSYFLARWSLQNDVRNLHRYRQELSLHLRSARNGEVHDHLNALVFDFMNRLIAGDFHPAVQINAMLMIGELNQTEQIGREAAVPSPETMKMLLKASEDAKLSDGLRAAAMIGILRHATASIQDDDARKSLGAAMLRLAAAELPTGAAAPGRAWIRAQAIETLGALGSVGENNAVFKTLLDAVADAKLPLSVRIAAANSLGNLDYSSAGGINPSEAATALGQLAADACANELQLAKDSGGAVSRRRLVLCLDAVIAAIVGGDDTSRKGVASLAKEADQQAILDELTKTITTACETLDDRRHTDDDMTPIVKELQTKLATWLQKKPK